MCKIVAREGIASLVKIPTLLYKISQENERGLYIPHLTQWDAGQVCEKKDELNGDAKNDGAARRTYGHV